MKSFTEKDLKGYQEYMAEAVVDQDQLGLWAEMGLGKTVSALTGVSRRIELGKTKRTLAIAPLLVANNTWPDEIEKWDHLRHLKYSLVTGTEKERLLGLSSPADIHIINRENVTWLYKLFGRAWPFDTVVIDECSSFKNPALRTAPTKKQILDAEEEAAAEAEIYGIDFNKALRRAAKKIKPGITRFAALAQARRNSFSNIIQLGGTPAPNGYLDLWSQIYLLDKGERFGSSFYQFRKEFFVPDHSGYKWTPKEKTSEYIKSGLGGLCHSLKAEDYLELPRLFISPVWVRLNDGIMRKYRKFERSFALESDQAVIEAVSEGSLTGKLLQLANGAVYDEDREVHWFHDEKLNALESVIEEAAGEPVLVSYSFRHDIPRIKRRFPNAVLAEEVPNVVAKWNRREIPILLVHAASAGHGLNLQFGGNIAVWFGIPWSLEFYQQFNKRLHRPGQERPVFIYVILAEDTIDERVQDVLSMKDATQEDIKNAVKAVVKRCRK